MDHVVRGSRRRTYHGHWHRFSFDSRSCIYIEACNVIGWFSWRAYVDVSSKQSTVARLIEHFTTVIRCGCVVFSFNVFRESVNRPFVRVLSCPEWLSVWIVMSSTVKFTSDEILGGEWISVSSNDASSCLSIERCGHFTRCGLRINKCNLASFYAIGVFLFARTIRLRHFPWKLFVYFKISLAIRSNVNFKDFGAIICWLAMPVLLQDTRT